MTTGSIRLVIFDWDGTLCDSHGRIVFAMREAFVACGEPPPTTADIRAIIGLGLHDSIYRLAPVLTSAAVDSIANAYRAGFVAAGHINTPMFDGARQLLDGLIARGLNLAVATGKSRVGLDRALAEFDLVDYFYATRCADESEAKPAPDMIEELMIECDVSAREAVMVGDSEHDIEMARAAGISSIGAAYGSHSPDALQRSGPTMTINTLDGLPGAIEYIATLE